MDDVTPAQLQSFIDQRLKKLIVDFDTEIDETSEGVFASLGQQDNINESEARAIATQVRDMFNGDGLDVSGIMPAGSETTESDAIFKAMSYNLLTIRLNNHLQDVLSAGLMDEIDKAVEASELTIMQAYFLYMFLYRRRLGVDLSTYISKVREEIHGRLKIMYNLMRADIERLSKLPAEEREDLVALIRQNNWAEVQNRFSLSVDISAEMLGDEDTDDNDSTEDRVTAQYGQNVPAAPTTTATSGATGTSVNPGS
jgi:hypothetical protein